MDGDEVVSIERRDDNHKVFEALANPAPSSNLSLPARRPLYTENTPSDPVQVITSLIDSLGALSTSARQGLQADRSRKNKNISRPSTLPEPDPDDLDRCLHDPSTIEDSSDGEVAAAPVAGYARRPKLVTKSVSKSRLYSLNMSQPRLSIRASQQSLKSLAETDSIGVPSVERRHGSSASSAISIISPNVLQHKPHPDSHRDWTAIRPIPPKRFSSDRRKKTESLHSMEQKVDRYHTRSSSVDGYSTGGVQEEASSIENPGLSSQSRLRSGDVTNHMIPDRRSSLRRSITGMSDTSQESRKSSMPTKAPKELEIDSDLLESDDSTVRRIRELQEARERRQKEWRNEAKKSERAAKRHTIATAKVARRSSPYPNSRLSVTEVVVESPEAESPLMLSATMKASDLATMPTIVNVPQTPLTPITPASPFGPHLGSAGPSRSNSTYKQNKSPSMRHSAGNSVKQDTGLSELRAVSEEVDSFLGAPRFTQKIRHPRTGRTIAFSEVGDPDGFAVFCCVGMGLTRYLTAFYDELTTTLRLRLITPDRPGVGESTSVPEASCTPLNWVDDVAVICSTLGITRFSLLAHSAGAIYALATALKMPQYVRGRIHLLAPWIPPSQMPKGAALRQSSQAVANLPLSHKILSVLPAQFLKVANSRFLTATSASVDTRPLTKKNKNFESLEASLGSTMYDMRDDSPLDGSIIGADKENVQSARMDKGRSVSCYQATNEALGVANVTVEAARSKSYRQTSSSMQQPLSPIPPLSPRLSPEKRQALYNETLTHRIWALATLNANPASDLVICLERRKTIGFRYPEVTRSVVIHHGAKDTRVPLDNVRWLQSVMKRCELKVLEEEGHGLMASASAMSTVLGEMAREWEEWEKIAQGKEKKTREDKASTFSGVR